MSERYSRLYLLPASLYAENAPVIIEAGTLLQDAINNGLIIQLKFYSLSDKKIKALKAGAKLFNVAGEVIDEVPEAWYLDLDVSRGNSFGQNVPIPMISRLARSYEPFVSEVVFEDGTKWLADGSGWMALSPKKSLRDVLNNELLEQYSEVMGEKCLNLPEKRGDLWLCTCGAYNAGIEKGCAVCGKYLDAELEALDNDFLQQRVDKAKEAEEKKRKKATKILSLVAAAAVACIAVMLLITKVIKPAMEVKAAERAAEEAYSIAQQLEADGKYEEAISAFEKLDGYKDSAEQIVSCETALKDAAYTDAVALMNDGKNAAAAMEYAKLSDYKDAKEKSFALWDDIAVRKTVAAGDYHTMGLRSDGTVVAVGYNKDGRCDVSGWKDIVAISAGSAHTVGLRSDGTVVAVGYNKDGRCDVSGWTDIVAISAGDYHTMGLRSDGTVVAVGYNKDGRCDVSGRTDIVAISAGGGHTVGLCSDGTVVAVGNNYGGRCDVSDWKDIVAISAGLFHTVGLRSDGTVIAVGGNGNGQCKVSGWTDIKLPK